SRKLFDSRLNKNPVEGKIAQTVFHYNRKISFARAVDMEAMAAEINELTWRWRTRHLGSRRWPATNHGYRQNSQNDRSPNSVHASSSVPGKNQENGTQEEAQSFRIVTS